MGKGKKVFVTVLFVLMSIVACLGVTACGKHKHVYTETVINATCTEQGYTLHICSCGDEYSDSYTDALGHEYANYVSDNNATCTQDGTKTAYCSHGCGTKDTLTDTGSKLPHTSNKQVATNEYLASVATCTQKAIYYYSCECGRKDTKTFEYGSTIDHSYGEWIDEKSATCTVAGTKGHYFCKLCKKNFDINKKELNDLVIPAGHNYIGGACSECGEKKPSEGLVFTLMNGYYAVAGIGTCIDTDIVIPSTYNNKPVKSISDYAFLYCDSLTSVTIPDSVMSIGGYAFEYCSKLTSVTIGNGVTRIGGYALHGCSSLTSIIIPDSVTSIGSRAFYGCGKLKSIAIGNGLTSIEKGMLFGCGSLEEITIPFVGAIAGKASIDTYQYPFGYIFGTNSYTGGTATKQFYYGSSTSSITDTIYYIPSGLKKVTVTGSNILYGAFYNCTSLTSVTIGNSVTSIGSRAFYDCTSLTSITIGNSVTSIGSRAFT